MTPPNDSPLSVVPLDDKAAAKAAATASDSLIDWPLPPFHELAGEVAPAFESAMVTFRDGRRQSGRMMRFSPANGLIEFCPERAATAVVLAVTDIVELRMVRPIRLRPRKSALQGKAGHAGAPSAVQPFRIELCNATVAEGETLGFQVHTVGLFLYIRSHQDLVIRTFFPATAIRSKQIGQRLGELLVAGGTISEDQLDAALARQKLERDKPLGELLVELGFLTRQDLVRALTQKLGIPYVDLERFPIDRQVLDMVPRAVAIESNVLPLCMEGRNLVLAVENPLDPKPLDRIRFLAATMVTAVMASGEDIRRAIARHFVDPSIDSPIENIAAELESPTGRIDTEDELDLALENDSALVRLVNKTIADARASGASDIHVESNGGKSLLRIRFRQDGVLREYLTLPANYRRSLVSRIKIMASLDISERRRGQDGKIRFQQAGASPLELRVATIPTIDGREDVVLRLLSSGVPIPLDKLGLRPQVRDEVDRLARKPYGIFIVCGPTGSGKSTTLHSILGHINKPDMKIWTAEDPVEIQQEGLRQVQVNTKTGWTFAAAMRSFLRADPDVIMVGEMRDEETAQIAIEASLTGHTVFSTLHTNSAVDSVLRLLDMGVQPFNFADSLLGVLSQRLVRRLCDRCRAPQPMEAARAKALATEYCAGTTLQPLATLNEWEGTLGPLQAWHAPGCEHCRDTGYRSRAGIHELFVNTPRVTPLIHGRADGQALRAAAFADGMRTLRQDGIEKVLQGITDMKEVRASCM